MTAAPPIDPRPTVLVIGPVPPPAFGVAKATALMIDSPVLAERLRVLHLDTSDRRGVANIGRFDLSNVWLAFEHMGRLVRLCLHDRPDVTLLTASQGTLGLLRDALLAGIGRIFGSKLAVYMRGSGYADLRSARGRPAAWILRSLVKHSALVLVLGESLVGMARAIEAKAKVAVAPNGCPPAVAPEAVGRRHDGHPVLAYIGRLSRDKGLDDALEVIRQVAAACPPVEVVLAGEWEPPDYEALIRARVTQCGLEGAVHFPGPVDHEEKADLLERAWVLMLPSPSEGQPWVILEAMSAGVPVVAMDTGTIAETVGDGIAGFVVPVGKPETMATRVLELFSDDRLWKRMSEQAVERYTRQYTLEASHRRLAGELCRIAERKRGPHDPAPGGD